ncbi:MAG: MotA/TolQ/ExbB proton channel family protein [Pseudomonadota bacterium]
MSLNTDSNENFILSTENLDFLIDAGGPVLIILLILSVVALTIIIAKALQLIAIDSSYSKTCDQILHNWIHSRSIHAINDTKNTNNPIVKVVVATVKGLTASNLDYENVRNEVTRIAKSELEKLRSFLKSLEVIATITPLLGLLGTVLGMIKAFQQLQKAGANVDPSILSGGIWEALLTTAAGLSVAIPAFIAYTWLDKKVDRTRLNMEDYVTRLLSTEAYTTMSSKELPNDKTLNVTNQPVT